MTTFIKTWLTVSLITILLATATIVILKPLWGMDFTGGSLIEMTTNETQIDIVRQLLEDELRLNVTVQTGEESSMIIKTTHLDEDKHQLLLSTLRRENIIKEELRFESIGPTIGAELRQKSITAILLVVVVIVLYLAYTFRQASGFVSSWKFGLAAVYALIHDLLVVMAVFVLLGKFYDVPINTLFVTAMLAILGYSVNDTIVIFNRLKSEWLLTRSGNLASILKTAVNKSIVRSLNTSFTTIIVLISLLFFGGTTIRWFIVALTIGTIVGTYSSLLVAPPALYFLAKTKK